MKKKQNKSKQNLKRNLDIRDFQLLRDLILVEEIRPEASSGLVNPHQYDEKCQFGKVVSVGNDVVDIKVGDVIRFGQYSTESIRTNGADLYLVHEEDCHGVLK